MSKRVTFAASAESIDTAIPVSNGDVQMWSSRLDYARNDLEAAAEASRLVRLKASGQRFTENDFYEIIGLEVSLLNDLLLHILRLHFPLPNLYRYAVHQKYLSLREIGERNRLHTRYIIKMQKYCDDTRLGQLSEESSKWTRERAQKLGLLHFDIPHLN